jgi:ABC-type glutathione transport system ATPase component
MLFEIVKTRSAVFHSIDRTLGGAAIDSIPDACEEAARQYIAQLSTETREVGEHFLFVGSSGSGKSTTIRSLLRQIEARAETAIVLDSEFAVILRKIAALPRRRDKVIAEGSEIR